MEIKEKIRIVVLGMAVFWGLSVVSLSAVPRKSINVKDLLGAEWHYGLFYITFYPDGTYKRETRHKNNVVGLCKGRYWIKRNIIELTGSCGTQRHSVRLEVKLLNRFRMDVIRHAKDVISRKISSIKATYRKEPIY